MTELPLSARSFHVVDCPTNSFDWPRGFCGMHLLGEVLIVHTYDALLFLDASDPTCVRELSRREPRFGSATRTKLFGTRLVVVSEGFASGGGVEVLDLEDPASPRTIAAHPFPSGTFHSGAFAGGRFIVLTEHGLAAVDLFGDGSLTPLVDLPAGSDRGYRSDVIAHGDLVVTSRRHQGLHVFRLDGDGGRHIKGITTGYFGDWLAWEEEGRTLLHCNDESVFRVDVSVPEKAKRHKSVKLTGCRAGEAWARVGDEAVLAGLNGRDQLCVMVFDLSDPSALRLAGKQTVKGFERREVGSDEIRGVLWRKDHLLVASKERRLYVLEGREK